MGLASRCQLSFVAAPRPTLAKMIHGNVEEAVGLALKVLSHARRVRSPNTSLAVEGFTI